MTRPGEDLQRLVRVIERATHQDANVLVESPKRLPDKDTGQLREHDVVLTLKQRHHKVLVGLECRDRSRKVGVPDVEAFNSKCQRTGIDRGLLVSSIGFAQTALRKAASYGIGCLGLDEAARLDWCLAQGIQVDERRLIHVRLHPVADRRVGAGARLYVSDGTVVGQREIEGVGRHCLNHHSSSSIGRFTQRFLYLAPALYLVEESGDRVGVQAGPARSRTARR
jgi:hypothetical protein